MLITLSILFIPYGLLLGFLFIFLGISLWHLLKFAPFESMPFLAVMAVGILLLVVLLATSTALQTIDWSWPLFQFSGGGSNNLPF